MNESMKQWRCPFCDGMNDWQNEVCEICGDGKRSEVIKPEAGSKSEKSTQANEMHTEEVRSSLNSSSLYDQALLIMQKATDERTYNTAAERFRALGEYRDAPAKAKECREQAEQARFATKEKKDKARHKGRAGLIVFLILAIAAVITGFVKKNSFPNPDGYGRQEFTVGNVICFGHYEQDDNNTNGKDVIEWIVLNNDGKTATLISKYGLDAKPYNGEHNLQVTWEGCSLCKWLNSSFLDAAFTEDEQSRLQTVSAEFDSKSRYISPSNDTHNKVFLLSAIEADSLFPSDDARVCKPTKAVEANGAHTDSSGACWWWLRSRYHYGADPSYVRRDGSINEQGNNMDLASGVVRPAIVMRLSN